MQPAHAGNLLEYLTQIPDPRGRQGRRFSLSAMLSTVVAALLTGARGFEAIADWIHALPPKQWHRLGYYRKPPTANAFRYLLMAIDPQALEEALRKWMQAVLPDVPPSETLQALAMDGKTLCGTEDAYDRAVHLLSLFDHSTKCLLSQMLVEGKTNEIPAGPELLQTVSLVGRIVTADAMHCQRETCQQIRDRGGHYLLVVKDNQHELYETLHAEFQAAFSPRD
jgi:DDE_Tnp_1-associated/Transposase DDE domain